MAFAEFSGDELLCEYLKYIVVIEHPADREKINIIAIIGVPKLVDTYWLKPIVRPNAITPKKVVSRIPKVVQPIIQPIIQPINVPRMRMPVGVIAPIGGKKPKPNMNANTIAQVKRCLLELAACAPMIFPPN